jgi:hypothetical protein
MNRLLAVFLGFSFGLPAAAGDLNLGNLASQAEFRAVAEDLGAALSYKPLTPSASLGITGFDVGLATTVTKVENSAALARAGVTASHVVVPTVRLHKGLPFGVDMGVMYSRVPGTDISLWGGELRYALIDGGVAMPAVGIRGSYTRVTGVSQLDFDTKGLDVSISKGFTLFTPYAGVGAVWVSATPNGVAGLSKESMTQGKLFAGLNANFGFMNLALEGDRTGEVTTYGLKLGFRF